MLNRYEQFTTAIWVVERSIQHIEHAEMERYGLRGAYAPYLTALWRGCPEGMTSAQLSERCRRDKAAVSRAVTEMEGKGLVIRQSSGESLYRAHIRLTEAGRRAAEYVCRRAREVVEAVGGRLSEQERGTFYRVLDQIAANLQTVCRDGLPKHEE